MTIVGHYSSASFTTFAAATLLAQVVNPVTPVEGWFSMGTLEVTTGSAQVNLGENLILRLGGAMAVIAERRAKWRAKA